MALSLLVSYSGVLGGAERALLDFAGGLEGPVCVACPEGAMAVSARGAGFRVMALRERSLVLHGSVARAALGLAAHRREIRRLIRDLDPDIVVASGMRSGIACLTGALPGMPVAFVHHDFLPGRVVGMLVRAAARRATVVLAVSRAVARDLDPRGLLGERLVIVHPGVDPDRFASESRAAEPPEILVLGALVEWKHPELALEACAIARRQRPDLRMRVIGAPIPGDGERVLERLRKRAGAPDLSGAVELTGPIEDPSEAFRRATCLLHSAEREPFGIVVLEALASSRPAVVPASAGPAEIVDSSCGVLYPPGDAAAAAAALVGLCGDRQRAASLGHAGRQRVQEHFTVDGARSRFAAAVAPAVRRRRAPPIPPRELAIVTVSYNSAPQLDRLLRSVERHLPGTRVIVADCASEDDSLTVAGQHPAAVPLALGQNVGFGRGCNAAVAEVREPVTALLNPDVELLDDSLLALAASLVRDSDQNRLLAPLVLDPDGSRQDTVHPLPTSGPDLLRALIPPAALPGRAGEALAPWRARAPRRVGWAVGCAVIGRTDTLRALGPFDERIFMYGEDLDLALRAAAADIDTWFCPEARVLHDQAHSTSVAFGGEPFVELARGRREVVARRLGARRARVDDLAQALTFCSRIALKRTVGRPATRERRQLQALLAARR